MPTTPESLSTKYHPKQVITQVSTEEPFQNRKPICKDVEVLPPTPPISL